ncbi:MAG: hypothetical protein LBL83_11880, partial [Clostridiales bacterium]|nr:hypothetical protein [Clostridiales bacterium]
MLKCEKRKNLTHPNHEYTIIFEPLAAHAFACPCYWGADCALIGGPDLQLIVRYVKPYFARMSAGITIKLAGTLM